MARQDEEFVIDKGPSKLDLILSLFDTEMGTRKVEFRAMREIAGEYKSHFWYSIIIISVRRLIPTAKIWGIEGIIEVPDGNKRVSICYLSDKREGSMRIYDELQTQGAMETPSDARKARALMIVIEKMIARYQNSHSDNLDEEIFKLFEKAKMVNLAKEDNALTEAIKKI